MNVSSSCGKLPCMGVVTKAMMAAEKPGSLAVELPEVETRAWTSQGDPANDWLCAWCFNRVASEKERLHSNGKSEYFFVNPVGIRFNILTFSQTIGCQQEGIPTLEHTWFPGYAWSYCLCDRCRIHLGWHFSGPSEFDGLIRDRIIRAMLILN